MARTGRRPTKSSKGKAAGSPPAGKRPRRKAAAPAAAGAMVSLADVDIRRLEERLRAVSAIGGVMAGSVGLDGLFRQLVPHITTLMRAARTTLFLYDDARHQIWS